MKKILIIIIAFVILGLFILAKPYETLQEKRVDADKITILTKFINVTGSPNCAKLYMIESVSNIEKNSAIFTATPETIPAPDDGEYAYADNIFKITGYPYEWIYTNLITGDEHRKKSKRFDVVKWEIITPYTVWLPQQGDGPLIEKRTTALVYKLKSDDHRAVLFKMDNYIDCFAGQ